MQCQMICGFLDAAADSPSWRWSRGNTQGCASKLVALGVGKTWFIMCLFPHTPPWPGSSSPHDLTEHGVEEMHTMDSFQAMQASSSTHLLSPISQVGGLSPKTSRVGTWDRLVRQTRKAESMTAPCSGSKNSSGYNVM